MRPARTVSLAALLLLVGGAAARAESLPAEALALGAQTEAAGTVVVARVVAGGGETRQLELRVEEAIRGRFDVGDVLTVESAGVCEPVALPAGSRCLAFLEGSSTDPGRGTVLRSVTGSLGIRPLPQEGPETRFPEIVRRIAATLDPGGTVRDPSTLRALLVEWMEDADPGVACSAAFDLVRHEELHAGLTAEERLRIVEAYRRCPVGKQTKKALALACAATRHPAAAEALVDSLVVEGAKSIRGVVAESLRRLAAPDAEARIDAKLAVSSVAERENLLAALGAFGGAGAVPTARRCLADPAPSVRLEAAHALGRIARHAREDDASVRVEGREDLAQVAATGKDVNEVRAALWALAQLDDQEAWAILRRIAADDPREFVGRFARRCLSAPRSSFIAE